MGILAGLGLVEKVPDKNGTHEITEAGKALAATLTTNTERS
jgi:hypothetical protein